MRLRVSSPRELALALRIAAVAVAVPVLVRLKLPRLEAVLEPRTGRVERPAADVERLVRLIDETLRAVRPVVRRGCLTRGITRYYFLRRAGVDVRLTFGVGVSDGRSEGHCWLVREDVPYLETHDPRPRFTEMYTIPHGEGGASR